jgi:serine/threonine-protein kinase
VPDPDRRSDPPQPAELLAGLVHAGLLDAEIARRALAADPDSESLAGVVEQLAGWGAGEFERRVARDPERPPQLPGYRVAGLLGRGGTARVWRAHGTREGGAVALKVLTPQSTAHAPTRDAFLREAKLLAELDHENLVGGFGPAKSGDLLLSRLECIDGETALEALERDGAFDEGRALEIVLGAARALEYLSARGLVHRDVKPGNVMLERGGRVVLIDLGFAADESSVDRNADSTVGTAAYLSPEQARGGAAADPRSDVYSLGATLFHLVVGRLPFEASDDEELLAKQVLESLASPELKSRGVSPYLQFFIEKMMSKEADQRFQTWSELIAEIESTREAVARLDLSGMREQGAPTRRPRRRR